MTGDDRDQRPRRSWREIDQMRDGTHRDSERRPRGPAADARAGAATREYVKGLDGLFSRGRGGAEGEELASAMRAVHGTPELAGACRAYLEAVGMPEDISLLSLFLDAGDSDLVLAALDALAGLHGDGSLQLRSGLKSQIQLLEQGIDDAVAEAAEELLARF